MYTKNIPDAGPPSGAAVRFEIYYMPKHGNWLNIAEIEFIDFDPPMPCARADGGGNHQTRDFCLGKHA